MVKTVNFLAVSEQLSYGTHSGNEETRAAGFPRLPTLVSRATWHPLRPRVKVLEHFGEMSSMFLRQKVEVSMNVNLANTTNYVETCSSAQMR